jgi:hypothetical protein
MAATAPNRLPPPHPLLLVLLLLVLVLVVVLVESELRASCILLETSLLVSGANKHRVYGGGGGGGGGGGNNGFRPARAPRRFGAIRGVVGK